jgi:hypothetical protein
VDPLGEELCRLYRPLGETTLLFLGTDGPAVDGTPATGKQYNLPGVSIVQVEGDKIRTERVYFDLLGLQYQLGLMEQKAPVAETK